MTTHHTASRQPSREEIAAVLDLVARHARAYLDTLDDRPARSPDFRSASTKLKGPLPENGDGALDAMRLLIENGIDAAVASAGPRCFHLVIGETTPAALAADWLASALVESRPHHAVLRRYIGKQGCPAARGGLESIVAWAGRDLAEPWATRSIHRWGGDLKVACPAL